MKKKEKYIAKKGITGIGEDYCVYNMSINEKMIGFLIGITAGFAATQIMFGVWLVSLIIGCITGYVAIPIYKNYLIKKRRKAMLMQFRDVLDLLSNAFSAGQNVQSAFQDTYTELKNSYGEGAYMVNEMLIIVQGMASNFNIEELLNDMAVRCNIDDITSFTDTFIASNRIAGNHKKIVSDTRDIIRDKIEIEMEIETTVSANKNEMNIMCVMPFIIIAMMGMIGEESITANSALNVLIKIIAAVIFIVAYVVGRKITDIKV